MLEHGDTAFDEPISVDRCPDTLRASIRYRGLLHAQLRGHLGHAARLHHIEKYMEVAHSNGAHIAWRWYGK
jgi:hypothetical protein